MKHFMMCRLSPLWGTLALVLVHNLQLFTQNIPIVIAQEAPKGECLEAFGRVVCGYNCVESFGTIKCADWPGGVCRESFGKITCGPPAPPNWILLYRPGNAQNPNRCDKIRDVRQLANREELDDDTLAVLEYRYCVRRRQ